MKASKIGLVYKEPGNQDKARSHEEVKQKTGVSDSDGITSGLSSAECFNEDVIIRKQLEDLGLGW
jgi:hypothetical protein